MSQSLDPSQAPTEPIPANPTTGEIVSKVFGNEYPIKVQNYTESAHKIILRTGHDIEPQLITGNSDGDLWVQPLPPYEVFFNLTVLSTAMDNALPDPEDPDSCYVLYPHLNKKKDEVESIFLCKIPKKILQKISTLIKQNEPKIQDLKPRYSTQINQIPIVQRWIRRSDGLIFQEGNPVFMDRRMKLHPSQSELNNRFMLSPNNGIKAAWGFSYFKSWTDENAQRHILFSIPERMQPLPQVYIRNR